MEVGQHEHHDLQISAAMGLWKVLHSMSSGKTWPCGGCCRDFGVAEVCWLLTGRFCSTRLEKVAISTMMLVSKILQASIWVQLDPICSIGKWIMSLVPLEVMYWNKRVRVIPAASTSDSCFILPLHCVGVGMGFWDLPGSLQVELVCVCVCVCMCVWVCYVFF